MFVREGHASIDYQALTVRRVVYKLGATDDTGFEVAKKVYHHVPSKRLSHNALLTRPPAS